MSEPETMNSNLKSTLWTDL